MIEFNGQDTPAFDEVMGVLKRYPDFECEMQGQGHPHGGIWRTPPEGKTAVRWHGTDGMSGTLVWLLQHGRETAGFP